MKLSEELQAYGCDLGEEEFTDRLLELFVQHHPSLTYEQFAREPTRLAAKFCRLAAAQLGKRLPENVIMGTIENARKAGLMSRT